MNEVTVVSAYVPLQVKHGNAKSYHEYGDRLSRLLGQRFCFFDDFPLTDCWLMRDNPKILELPPATEAAKDRYATPADFVRSNVVQHNRTDWAMLALDAHATDVIVWLDLALMKQGAWRNNQITEDHIARFIEKVENYPHFHRDIPFPGISESTQVDPRGNNWRFCGSTHIWPVWALPQIDKVYKQETRKFIDCHACVPLDLAIWPAVERRAGLPFRWYKAEYDASQLTEFPNV